MDTTGSFISLSVEKMCPFTVPCRCSFTAIHLSHFSFLTAMRRLILSSLCRERLLRPQVLPASAPSSPAEEEPSSSPLPKELRFYRDFEVTEKDYHYLLLSEANVKHGVFMNVPPQLPPKIDPPSVPVVILPAAQQARLSGLQLAYSPMHGPPPLNTAGTRGLQDILTITTSTKVVSAPSVESASGEKRVLRRAVEPDKRFHCSLCGKPFRILQSAQLHIQEIHRGQATVAEGPGIGEIIPMENEKSSPQPSPTAKGGPKVLKEVSTKAKAGLRLPEEGDIDALLCEVWDVVGKKMDDKSFVMFSETVVASADNRREGDPGDLKPSLRATPEDAAPGVKRLAAVTPRNALHIKQMSARFSNPFGDKTETFEEDNEPPNPFVLEKDLGDVLASSPSIEAAADAKIFECHVCFKRFRIRDSLLDHYLDVHDMEPSLDELPQGASRSALYASTRKMLQADGQICSKEGLNDDDESKSGATEGIPPPLHETEVSVHMSACSNTVIIGEVVDVQKGFLGSNKVTQLVVKVGEDEEPSSLTQSEWITVRVFGDSLSFVLDSVRSGSSVMVHGSLRMNRRVDAAVKRSHAYPYVQVVPPLGSILVVEPA